MNIELTILLINAGTIWATTGFIGFVGSYVAKWVSPTNKEGDEILEVQTPWYRITKVEWGFVALNLLVGGYQFYPDISLGTLAGAIAAIAWYLILTIPDLFKRL